MSSSFKAPRSKPIEGGWDWNGRSCLWERGRELIASVGGYCAVSSYASLRHRNPCSFLACKYPQDFSWSTSGPTSSANKLIRLFFVLFLTSPPPPGKIWKTQIQGVCRIATPSQCGAAPVSVLWTSRFARTTPAIRGRKMKLLVTGLQVGDSPLPLTPSPSFKC